MAPYHLVAISMSVVWPILTLILALVLKHADDLPPDAAAMSKVKGE